MTKQGTLLSLCSVPLLQGLWSTPKSAHSLPTVRQDRAGCLLLPIPIAVASRELRRDDETLHSFSNLHSQLRISFLRLPSYIQLHRNALAGNWLERNPEYSPGGHTAATVHVDNVNHMGISNIRNCQKILYSSLCCPSLTHHQDVKYESSRLVL